MRKRGGILRRDSFLSQGLMLALFGPRFPISREELLGLVKVNTARFLIRNSYRLFWGSNEGNI